MQITWRPQAREDITHARRYIEQHSPKGARRVVLEIYAAVQRLADAPHLGHPGRVAGTREAVVPRTPYIVAYSVVGNQLLILSVIHGAREWPERF